MLAHRCQGLVATPQLLPRTFYTSSPRCGFHSQMGAEPVINEYFWSAHTPAGSQCLVGGLCGTHAQPRVLEGHTSPGSAAGHGSMGITPDECSVTAHASAGALLWSCWGFHQRAEPAQHVVFLTFYILEGIEN